MVGEKDNQELQQTVNREIRNLNMHLYGSRSLTAKDMLVNVREKKKKRKETTRLYNGRKKDDTSQVKEEGKKNLFDWIPHNLCLFDVLLV